MPCPPHVPKIYVKKQNLSPSDHLNQLIKELPLNTFNPKKTLKKLWIDIRLHAQHNNIETS